MAKAVKRVEVSRFSIAVILIVIIAISGGAVYYTQTNPVITTRTNTVTTTSVNTVTNTVTTSQSSTQTTSRTTTQSRFGGTLNIGVDTQADSLDPLNALSIPFSGGALFELYDSLVYYGPSGTFLPGLATSWTSTNATVWTFQLKQNVFFQDGTPFNATAVKFTFDRSVSTPTAVNSLRYLIRNVTITGTYGVQFIVRSDGPYGQFLSVMASAPALIVSPTAVRLSGDTFGRHPVGTGPYKFFEWVNNDHLTLEVNPTYWGTKPYITRIITRVIPDPTTRLLALQSGQIQLADVAPQYVAQINSTAGTKVHVGLFNRVLVMDINMNSKGNPAMQDVRVRQALSYATNRTELVNAIYYGYGIADSNGPLIPGLDDPFVPSVSVYPAGGNVSKAKELMAQAGYPKGINVTIEFAGTFVNSLTIATILQQQWAAANIQVTLKNVAFSVYITDLVVNRDYQLDIHDSGGATPYDHFSGYLPSFRNLGNFNDTEIATLVKQLGTTDISKVSGYQNLSNRINNLALQKSYLVYLFFAPIIQGWSNNLMDYNIPSAKYTGYIISSTPLGVNAWIKST